jgi:GMP synthase-like glutamine amidotransferase
VFGLPVEGLSVAGRCLKGSLQLAHAFGGAVDTEGAFDFGSVVLEMEAAGGGEWGGTEGAETDHFATTTGM